jgi:hypothetical protein
VFYGNRQDKYKFYVGRSSTDRKFWVSSSARRYPTSNVTKRRVLGRVSGARGDVVVVKVRQLYKFEGLGNTCKFMGCVITEQVQEDEAIFACLGGLNEPRPVV